jgi:hypothetical protein
MRRSYYDELHDKYLKISTTKQGTRYERLAAFVFKVLEESGAVIHDLKLLGESDTKSQIDVIFETDDGQKRTLIECKDFDVSGKDVGIGIVRCFWGVVDDIKPDEAIILTCNGFTKDALVYAKHKNIKLAVLRKFTELDGMDLIKSVNVNIKFLSCVNSSSHLTFSRKEHQNKWQNDLKASGIKGQEILMGEKPIYIIPSESERIQINKCLDRLLNEYPRETPGHIDLDVPVNGWTIEIENRGRIPIGKLKLSFDIVHFDYSMELASKKVAELILQGLKEDDLIIFDEDLKRYTINSETGEVAQRKIRDRY